MTDAQSRNVSAGGSATINGVLYQLLWSLLQASKATLSRDPEITDGKLTDVIIELEPVGGGGDLVVKTESRKLVEQLKARPDCGTWSLREIIESVIPDLYLAAKDIEEEIEFRFVTEGRIGNWQQVYMFFQSLRNIECQDNPLDGLDDTLELKFQNRKTDLDSTGNSDSFWNLESYTRRTLFEKVVAEVRRRKVVKDNETEIETCKKLWKVLANFEFIGGQLMGLVEQQIDARLLAVVDLNDEVTRIRDSLAMSLAGKATAGGVEINCEQFFKDNGLNAIPLSNLVELKRATQKYSRNLKFPRNSGRWV